MLMILENAKLHENAWSMALEQLTVPVVRLED